LVFAVADFYSAVVESPLLKHGSHPVFPGTRNKLFNFFFNFHFSKIHHQADLKKIRSQVFRFGKDPV